MAQAPDMARITLGVTENAATAGEVVARVNRAVAAILAGIHHGLRGQTMTLTADPSKVHLFSNGVSLLYR